MRRFRVFVALALALTSMAAVPAHAEPDVRAMAIRADDGREVVTLGLSKCVEVKAFDVSDPPRIVIDLPRVVWSSPHPALPVGAVKRVRRAWNTEKTYRVVLDLTEPRTVERKSVRPGRGCTVEVTIAGPKAHAPAPDSGKASGESPSTPSKPENNAEGGVVPPPDVVPERNARVSPPLPTIVIDAGHGGVDPGAIARTGQYEKHLTLAYAKALRDTLNATRRYRVRLTRDTDTFIPLKERVQRARAAGGDLFISIHADTASDVQARGLSVYTLSDTASDKESAALAERENRVDEIAGIDLRHEQADVANILIDLARRETKNRSSAFAEQVVRSVRRDVSVLQRPHRFAGFAVLKGPDVPAVLIEIGFLSHPQEGTRLNSTAHRAKVVRAISRAVDRYFRDFPKEK